MRPAGFEPAAYGSGGHPGVTLGVRGSDNVLCYRQRLG
jgi:hypothetical protein